MASINEVDFPADGSGWHGVRAELIEGGVWLLSYDDGDPDAEQSTVMGLDEAEKLAGWIKEQVAISRAAIASARGER